MPNFSLPSAPTRNAQKLYEKNYALDEKYEEESKEVDGAVGSKKQINLVSKDYQISLNYLRRNNKILSKYPLQKFRKVFAKTVRYAYQVNSRN